MKPASCTCDPAWTITGAGSAVLLRFSFGGQPVAQTVETATAQTVKDTVAATMARHPAVKQLPAMATDLERARKSLDAAAAELARLHDARREAIVTDTLDAWHDANSSREYGLISRRDAWAERVQLLQKQHDEAVEEIASARRAALAETKRQQAAALAQLREKLLKQLGDAVGPLLQDLLSCDKASQQLDGMTA